MAAPAMHDESQANELGRTMNRVLRTPLAGLRASMESLGSELRDQGSENAADTLAAALEQVTRLARDVADYAGLDYRAIGSGGRALGGSEEAPTTAQEARV